MASDATLVAQLAKLDAPGDADTGRLLGMVVALAGELFVVKAQLERLTRALDASGVLDTARLAAAGESEGMQAWLATEELALTRAVLRQWTAPDIAVNVADRMLEP